MTLRSLAPVGTPLSIHTVVSAFLAGRRGARVIEDFAASVKDVLGVSGCFLVSSGRAALTLILEVLREQAGLDRDEVVVPAYTCFSVPSAVAKAGLKVVPCDVDPRYLDFDQEMLPCIISSRTLGIIPNHLFGFPSRMDRVLEIARERGLYVVEDAAQAFGAKVNGQPVGRLGDVGFFSLGRGKPLSAIEGGVIVVPSSGEIASLLKERTRRLRIPLSKEWRILAKAVFFSLFFRPKLFGVAERLPFVKLGVSEFSIEYAIERLTPLQASLALDALREMDNLKDTREKNALALVESLKGTPGIEFLEQVDGTEAIYLRLPILLKSLEAREKLYHALRVRGLGPSRMYPSAITEIPLLAPYLGTYCPDCPQAKDVARRILTLPTHPMVTAEDRGVLVQCIKEMQRQ